jgi:glycosyltransferase 2 family protein
MKLKLLLAVSLSAFFLWWALRGLNWKEISEAFHGVDWTPIAWTPLTMVATHFFRARRWKILVRPIRDVTLWEMFRINAVGFMAINIFPLRLGEFTRPLLLKNRHGVAFTTGIATIAVERVFDLLTITLVLVIGFLWAPMSDQEIPQIGIKMRTMAFSALWVVIPIVAFLALTVVARSRAHALVSYASKFLPGRAQQTVQGVASNFFAGLEALPNPWSVMQLFLESLGVWSAVIVAYWLTFRAFHLNLHWSASFSVLGIAAVGIGLPAAPGFVGTFQVFIQAALALYGIDRALGFAYSIVIHAVNFLYSIGAGLAFLPSMSIGMGKLYDEASHQT